MLPIAHTRMLKRKINQLVGTLALFVSIFAVPSCFAQENSATLGRDLAIWRVKSSQNTLYLMGSAHVGEACQLRSQRVRAALNEAEVVVFEIELDEFTPAQQLKVGFHLLERSKLQDSDPTLRSMIDAKTYTTLSQRFNQLKPQGLPITLEDLNNSHRPWYIALQMTGFSILKSGLKPECGIDRILAQQAQAAGKEIIGLETLEYQADAIVNALDSAPASEINTVLQSLLEGETSKYASLLVGTVTAGEIDTLERLVADSCKETVKICNQLLTTRNQNWLLQIKSFLDQKKDYLVVVGAGHLVGEDGLIKLLEQENYDVERL